MLWSIKSTSISPWKIHLTILLIKQVASSLEMKLKVKSLILWIVQLISTLAMIFCLCLQLRNLTLSNIHLMFMILLSWSLTITLSIWWTLNLSKMWHCMELNLKLSLYGSTIKLCHLHLELKTRAPIVQRNIICWEDSERGKRFKKCSNKARRRAGLSTWGIGSRGTKVVKCRKVYVCLRKE